MTGLLAGAALRSLALGVAVGLGLWICRARSPRLRMSAWALVLVLALLMPVLVGMRWRTVEVAAPRHMVTRVAAAPVVSDAVHVYQAARATFSWKALVANVYIAVAVLLLLRLAIGLALTLRLWRRAVPIREPWTSGTAVREIEAIDAPVTFGSGILVPVDWREWDDLKRDAVLAHERAHIRWGDFYVQLLAQLHAAIFWFSPLAWWLRSRLALLAEAASDDAALAAMPDHASYAEILLYFAGRGQRPISAVAMARPRTVSTRVDRILSGAAAVAKTGWRAYAVAATLSVCAAVVIGGLSVRAQEQKEPAESHWRWSSDHRGDSWAIVDGDSLNMSGDMSDAERARSYRNRISGPYIWFTHNGNSYVISDPATVKRARDLFRPQEELGRTQGELGEQQGRLGEQQARLGEQQAGVKVRMPDLDRQVHDVREQIAILEKQMRDQQQSALADNDRKLEELEKEMQSQAGRELSQDQLSQMQERLSEVQSRMSDDLMNRMSEVQSRIGDLQSRLGELQSQAGEQQSKLGDAQSKLGEEQSKLGAKQSELGEEQSRLAEVASRQLEKLLQECLRNGIAKPAQ